MKELIATLVELIKYPELILVIVPVLPVISGGVFFKYPELKWYVIAVITIIYFSLRRKFLWDYRGKRGFDLWRSVIAAAALVGSGLVVIGWLFYRYWGLPPSFKDDQIGILVAEVPDQTNREEQVTYQNALRLRVQRNSELRELVKVRLIERPLPADADAQQAEAVKIGHWLRAAFVLRPFAVEGTQEPWLTVVNPQNMFQPESSLKKFSNLQLASLDTLPLPEDLTQLAEVALALALGKRHSYKEAAQILANVLASKHLPEAAQNRWALNFLRGNDLVQSGSFTDAAAEYKEAIRLKPDLVEAHNNLGNTFALKGQNAAAIDEYNKAISLNPNLAEAYYNLGVALDHQGQEAAAVAEYNKAISLNPNLADDAHNGLGAALAQQGQYAAAIDEYNKAISLNPNLAEAYYNLGVALDHQGQEAAAVAEYKKAISLRPNYAEAHNNLGNTFALKGQNTAAIAEYNKAISLRPDNAGTYYNLGVALDHQGQEAAAIAEYKKAISLNPNYAEAYYNLGVALDHQGQDTAAIAEYNKGDQPQPQLSRRVQQPG